MGVAIVNYACPICGKINESASRIFMNTKFSKKLADEIRSANNKTIGYSEKPCPECQQWIDKGAFFIIGVDAEKSDGNRNLWRTGDLVGIKKDSEFYRNLPDMYKCKPALFMDYREMRAIGLLQKASE